MSSGRSSWNFTSNLMGSNNRPPFEKLYAYLFIAGLAYMIADLAILKVRPEMLPKKSAKSRAVKNNFIVRRSSDYNSITSKNIFNKDGIIPPTLASEGKSEGGNLDGPAVASSLPLNLKGTIVHLDPKKSVASIEIKSKSKIVPFKVGDSIEGLAVITEISRRKVIFINSSSNNKEFIEIPLSLKLNLGLKSKKSKIEVSNAGRFQYSMKRSDVKKYTSNLTDVLKQARMQPNMGPGGRIQGFRFDWIQPDSIFSKLGFKVGDVIKGVDGEPINDPAKAMEAYRAFKSADKLTLDIVRDGQSDTIEYSITE